MVGVVVATEEIGVRIVSALNSSGWLYTNAVEIREGVMGSIDSGDWSVVDPEFQGRVGDCPLKLKDVTLGNVCCP